MANEAMIKKLIEEDRLRKLKAQKAFNAKMLKKNKKSAKKNQTAMTQDDVGFFQGLLGRSSEEEQRRLAGNMNPGPQLSLFDKAKNALGEAWTNENSAFKQGIWANEQIDLQEAEQAKAAQLKASGVPYGQPGSWTQGMGAAPYSPPAPQQGPVVSGQNPVTYKNMSDEDFARTYQQQRELMQPTVGTGVGDAIVDAGKYLYQNSIFGETNGMGPSQWADSEISRQEDERAYNTPEAINARRVAAEREAATKAEKQRMSLMGNAMSRYEPRPTPSLMDEQGRGGPAYPSMGPYQGLPFEGGPKNPEQMMYDGLNPDVKKQMDAQRAANAQVELEAYNAQINNPTADDIAPVSFVPEEVTSTTVIESVDAAVEVLTAGDPETNDEYVERTLNGETNLGKFLDFIGLIGEETEEVDEATADVVLSDLAAIANTTTEVKQDGLLVEKPTTATHTMDNGTVHTGATHTASSVPVNNSTSTASAVTTPSLMNTTVDSTAGFTMDRFKNPLSAENKAWWLGGGGGVPGNNRAKEFFDTLAYIGTPMKYRPSKTPSQQGMENRMTQQNNMLDYAASQKTTAPSFASLRAAVPSHKVIGDTIRGQIESGADTGYLFGMIGGDSPSDIDNTINEKATLIREKMLQMTLANNAIPSIQQAIEALSKATEAASTSPPAGSEPGVVDKALDTFNSFF
jgi:hypothetical protein